MPHALIAGGLGVIGRNLADHFSALPDWRVTALSRRTPDFETSAAYLSVDLLDTAATKAAIAPLTDVTHLFFAAYQEHADPKDLVSVNTAMLTSLVEATEAASPAFRRAMLYEGAKYYGVHIGEFRTPAKESDPRHMPPNFYYDQEDYLLGAAAGKAWDAVVMRPDVVCGFAVGNPMNLAMVIAVYAAISKELGLPLKFPGTATCYGKLAQVTDAAQLAAGTEWAALNAVGGEAYNLTNGDLFRWNQIWPAFAAAFGMEVGDVQTISLTEFMADKGPVWDRIVAKHGLLPVPYDKVASWGFGDFVFNCDYDVISSTTKIRQAGFAPVVDSEAMFLRLFQEFRERKVIP
ncbi:SDR family oxidoreductase [Acuticoccus mangrovi]|uniref:SDR family oxidoreductase n=1 Tax=Acuticoccus mangrovi TaxID=2796142 RepID=A0A934MJT0_9HYPH|nr:SDR family oxidoreductase [Acuticoccus mangrovi]MBJ3778631.1 SDR family oxidoreductase [Acuticoccus mangrovi]